MLKTNNSKVQRFSSRFLLTETSKFLDVLMLSLEHQLKDKEFSCGIGRCSYCNCIGFVGYGQECRRSGCYHHENIHL